MNTRRRAELQRKLALKSVRTPPDDLLERIKNDIPKYLAEDPSRRRETRSSTFALGVAASILVVATAAIFTVSLLEPEETLIESKGAPAMTGRTADASAQASDVPASEAAPAPFEAELQDAVQNSVPPAASASPPPALDEPARAADTHAGSVTGHVGAVADFAAAPSSAESFAPEPDAAQTAAPAAVQVATAESRHERQATAVEAPPQAAPSTVAAAAPPPPARQDAAAAAREGSLRHKAVAAAADEVFGVSVTPGAFDRVRDALMSGSSPGAELVDVEALVNYFAGGPARRPRTEPAIDVELSPAPVEGAPRRAILRVTVDTPAGRGPVAMEAGLSVDFDRVTVLGARRIGDGDALIPEPILSAGTSVTMLYELRLREPLLGPQRIATVRLRYSSLTRDGRPREVERLVRAGDVVPVWSSASRRHRLATLGAAWGEAVRAQAVVPDLARRAQELAAQNPRDSRAKELSEAASASEREN